MRKIKYFIGILVIIMFLFSPILLAVNNNCKPLYLNAYQCGISSNKTLEWDDKNVYTCNIYSFRFYTYPTWSCGGSWDTCQTWGFINNISCGNPTFHDLGGVNRFLLWESLDIDIINSNITFEVYLGKVGTVCGTIKVNNGFTYQDIDCDGDQEVYLNAGNTTNGYYDKIGTLIKPDISYYFNYTNTSAGANITTIGSDVTENAVELTGYFFNGTSVPAIHYRLGFNVSQNADMSNNFSYSSGTTGISQYFDIVIGNLTGNTYYFRAFGQNVSDNSYIYGEIMSFNLNITEKTFYLRFYDIQTSKVLHFKGYNIPDSDMGSLDFCELYINSELTNDGLVNSKSDSEGKVAITGSYPEGAYINFEFIGEGYNFYVRINNIGYSYLPIDRTFQVYTGQTFSVYIYPWDWDDGNVYPYNGGNRVDNAPVSIYLTERYYDYGDSVRIKYKLPSAKWLMDHGFGTTEDWYIAFYNTEYYWLGRNWNIWDYVYRIQLQGEDWGTTEWKKADFLIQNYNSKGFKEYFQKYEILIVRLSGDWGWFEKDRMYSGKFFYCTGYDFIPNGTITDISPNPCYMGQPVTFSWTSNGAGRLEVCRPYANGECNIIFTEPFLYSQATHTLTKTISTVGTLNVRLYTYSAIINSSDIPVDTDTLVCNPVGENGTYGSFGYGIPYLYIPIYRGIAGYDTIYIYYRTYKNDSLLSVFSPRYETTYFSTTVSNQSDNVLAIELQNYMQIGTWNVSFEGGDIYGNNITLNTSFNIVNEERNWIEFSKHTYTEDENFAVYIKHTYKVSLTFYKNNIAQGQSILLNMGQEDNTFYTIPIDAVKPSIGNWRVEMWRINDRNTVYELAEWECRVIKGAFIPPDTGLSISIASIPMFIRVIIGFGITLICTIIPLIVAMYLAKSKISINVPSMVYVAFFFMGLIIATVFGFLPIWIIFVVIFAMILTFAINWYFGQKENKVESEE